MDAGVFTTTLHANLVNIDCVGVLITGESGTGKSETSLQLISRGHALVADDVVEIKPTSAAPVGSPPVRLRQLIEIRGLGIADVVGFFGEGAYTAFSPVDVLIELISREASRRSLSMSISRGRLLGASLPKLRLRSGVENDLAREIEIAVDFLKSRDLIQQYGSA